MFAFKKTSLRLGFFGGSHLRGSAYLWVGSQCKLLVPEGWKHATVYVQDSSPFHGDLGAINVSSSSVFVTYCPQAVSIGMFAR